MFSSQRLLDCLPFNRWARLCCSRSWPLSFAKDRKFSNRPGPSIASANSLGARADPAGIHQSAEAILRPIHGIARSAAAGMILGHRILLRPIPQFLGHFAQRFVPCSRLEPHSKRCHERPELDSGLGPLHLPDPLMQLSVFPAAIANLQEPLQEGGNHDDPGETGLERISSAA